MDVPLVKPDIMPGGAQRPGQLVSRLFVRLPVADEYFDHRVFSSCPV
ncbi:MAG: hypothetical protein H7837_08155 [Magnetococcus sp. MYC-9]